MSLIDWNSLDVIGRIADSQNVECYLVGGAVRDYVLGIKPKDYDFVCTDSEKLIEKIKFFRNDIKVHKFENYGTFQFHFAGVDFEFVNPRKEIYRTWDHRPECSTGTIEDDIMRRDFTINTLAIKITTDVSKNHEIIDLTGRGLVDLDCFRLDCVSGHIKTFTEDPTRMIRAAVYAAKGFEPSTETMAAIRYCAHEIERIPHETLKSLIDKGILWNGFIMWLYDMELLTKIIPEFEGVEEIPQPPNHHTHDLINHTFAVVDNCPEDLQVRWAALFHDIGKIKTWEVYQHFKGHEYESEKIAFKIMERMRFSNKDKNVILHLVRNHMQVILTSIHHNNYGKRALGRFFLKHKGFLKKIKTLAEADIKGAGVHSKSDLEKLDLFFEELYKHIISVGIMGEEKFKLAISGYDIMDILGVKSSYTIGAVKRTLEKYVLEGRLKNTKEALSATLKKLAG